MNQHFMTLMLTLRWGLHWQRDLGGAERPFTKKDKKRQNKMEDNWVKGTDC